MTKWRCPELLFLVLLAAGCGHSEGEWKAQLDRYAALAQRCEESEAKLAAAQKELSSTPSNASMSLRDILSARLDRLRALRQSVDKVQSALFKEKRLSEDDWQRLVPVDEYAELTAIGPRRLQPLGPDLSARVTKFAASVRALDRLIVLLRATLESKRLHIAKILERTQTPTISFGVFVGRSERGPVGTLVRLAAPFPFDSPWPQRLDLLAVGEAIPGRRYLQGEPFVLPGRTETERPTVFVLPLEPDGIVRAFPDQVATDLQVQFQQALTILGEPDSHSGLLAQGEELLRALPGSQTSSQPIPQ